MTSPAVQLTALTVRDFRNIGAADLRLSTDGIVVVGENGQGKTNLVEAIAYLRLLRSLRGVRDRDLVRFGMPAFHIAAELEGTSARRVSAGVDRVGRKKVQLDGVETPKLTEALGALPSVSFSPRDVDLVAGSPAERRRFLDITLALTTPRYLQALRLYRASLLRRNAALRVAAKQGERSAGVSAWEPALAAQGAILVRERRAWVERWSSECARLAAAIGEPARAALQYESTLREERDPEEAMLVALAKQRTQDIRRGMTQTGPHRDDLGLTLDDHDLRIVGSAGQQRTIAIVLRMLEAATIREATGREPLLLLDDPFAELDRRRSACILSLLEERGMGQCVVCVPRDDEIPAQFTRLARWRVRTGHFTEER